MLLFSDLSFSRCFDSQHSANHRVCRLLGPLLDHDDHHCAAAPPSLPPPHSGRPWQRDARWRQGKDVSDMAVFPDRWPARNSRPTSSSPHPRLDLIREGQARQKRFTISTASLTAYLLEYLRLLPLAASPFSRLLPIGTPAVPRACWQMYAKRTRPSTRRIVPK
jgi:hypothetical protein